MPPASPIQEKLPGWAPAHLPQTFHGVSLPYYPFEEYFNTFPSGLNYLSKEGKMCCILIPWALHLLDSEGSLWWWYKYAWEVFIRHIESFRVGEGYDWNSEDCNILYYRDVRFYNGFYEMKFLMWRCQGTSLTLSPERKGLWNWVSPLPLPALKEASSFSNLSLNPPHAWHATVVLTV